MEERCPSSVPLRRVGRPGRKRKLLPVSMPSPFCVCVCLCVGDRPQGSLFTEGRNIKDTLITLWCVIPDPEICLSGVQTESGVKLGCPPVLSGAYLGLWPLFRNRRGKAGA